MTFSPKKIQEKRRDFGFSYPGNLVAIVF